MSKEKGDAFKAEGNKFFSAQQYDKAIASYTKAIEAYPQGHVYFSNRCACYTSLNQLDKALADATRCVELAPQWAKGYYRKGHALALLHQYEKAQEVLQQGAKVDPSNGDIKNRLQEVNALVSADKKKRAKYGNLSKAMAAKEEGNEFYKLGRFPEAIDCYTKGLGHATLDEEKIALLNNRAACRFQERSFRQAIADCSEVLALDPNNTKALLRRGLAYENIEKIDQGLADMKKLQEISPGIQKVTQAMHRLNRMKRQKEGHSW
mmetsp:Transcript_114813/g.161262  ORF Transcript_114813/g.161262 Transcript_114813/m.161262 type:complete len:264 (+) Transcript_114813:52-843(+)